MGVLIKASQIRHAYDGRSVLNIEDLEVMRGETLCLLGPNGAGKSTLVRILNLVEAPDSGSVLFEGKPVKPGCLSTRRRMAGVFQHPHIFRGSVRDNVAYGLKLRRLPRREVAALTDDALEQLALEGLGHRDARRLSRGEAQRVALARAVVVRPEVLFLDEPAGNLDAAARRRFLDDLRRIVRRLDTTVIHVTHSLDEALSTGDRIAIIKDGAIRQAGPARQVYNSPADIFTARFLGYENILPGTVVGEAAGGAVVELADGGRVYTRSRMRGDVNVCIRAEEVTLHPPGEAEQVAATANRFPGIIWTVEPSGSAHSLVLDCGFELVATATRPYVQELGLVPGAEVEVRFDEAAAQLVPARVPRGQAGAAACGEGETVRERA